MKKIPLILWAAGFIVFLFGEAANAGLSGAFTVYYDGPTVRADNLSAQTIFEDMNATTIFQSNIVKNCVQDDPVISGEYISYAQRCTFNQEVVDQAGNISLIPTSTDTMSINYALVDECDIWRLPGVSFVFELDSGRVVNSFTNDMRLTEADIISWYGGLVDLVESQLCNDFSCYSADLAVSSYDDPIMAITITSTYLYEEATGSATGCQTVYGGEPLSLGHSASFDPPAWSGVDTDGDGIPDEGDNCPLDSSIVRAEDPPYNYYYNLTDTDKDGLGDICDPDLDNDNVANETDNCEYVQNQDQTDNDNDGIGDVCDPCRSPIIGDDDCDLFASSLRGGDDNCPNTNNPSQADTDGDGIGDACDYDIDGDGIFKDNCPYVANSDQADDDGNSVGNACDGTPASDLDGDGIINIIDNCVHVANSDQKNSDGDRAGDACDNDDDNDGIEDTSDTCPTCDYEICGNSVREGIEQCDDGNRTNGDYCSSICTFESTCGDGLWEGIEQCDDGNTVDGDGCSSICQRECTPTTLYRDLDLDGYGNPLASIIACEPVSGYVVNGFDCDDNDYAIKPNYVDSPNPNFIDHPFNDNIDNNCDGVVDGMTGDLDQDGYTSSQDCDDTNPNVHPGAEEVLDYIDDDCDDLVDEGFRNDIDWDSVIYELDNCITVPNPDQKDSDYDGIGDACDPEDGSIPLPPSAVHVEHYFEDKVHMTWVQPTHNIDGTLLIDGLRPNLVVFSHTPGVAYSPGRYEFAFNSGQVLNDVYINTGLDGVLYFAVYAQDVNGNFSARSNEVSVVILSSQPCQDNDGDGFGTGTDISNCPGSTSEPDCNDGDAEVHPFAAELCDFIDNDCDGIVDESFDFDRDGYSLCEGDCDPRSPFIHPGADEICNGLDDNCDGNIDEGFDADLDTVADCFDNCASSRNPDQSDVDVDGAGDVCDVCPSDSDDLCDPSGSAAESIDQSGGVIATPDGSLLFEIPANALTTETSLSVTGNGSSFQLQTDDGDATGLYGVTILPEGQTFNEPVSVTLHWSDIDGNGIVDATSVAEGTLVVSKNGTVISNICALDPGCDPIANTFTVQVTSLSQFVIAALNGPPAVSIVDVPQGPVLINAGVAVRGEFTDPGFLDTHSAIWSWGDGTESPGIINENGGLGSVTGTHIYQHSGLYPVVLTVRDSHAEETIVSYEYIVVYDPEGDFVTGGGWILSPEGGYSYNPSASGKGTFSFVAKYKKDSTIPVGEADFQFMNAGLRFHSTGYQWLVIDAEGTKAILRGVGTIDGEGYYGFLLSVLDGGPSGGTDFFRIKIWDNGDNTPVYDSQDGSAYNEDPATVLGGGSVVIHKRK